MRSFLSSLVAGVSPSFTLSSLCLVFSYLKSKKRMEEFECEFKECDRTSNFKIVKLIEFNDYMWAVREKQTKIITRFLAWLCK